MKDKIGEKSMSVSNELSGLSKGIEGLKRDDVLEDVSVYRIMMESPFMPFCIFNSQGEILDFSAAVTTFMKCSREELLGKKISDYLNLEKKRRFWIKMRRQVQYEGITSGGVGLKTFDGQFRKVEYTVSSLQGDLYLVCFRDDSVCWENERFKDRFICLVSHISHELRRPLATISACLDLFHISFQEKSKGLEYLSSGDGRLEKGLSFNRDYQYLAAAARSVKQMTALINSMFELASLDLEKVILNKQKFLLEDLLKTVVEETRLTMADKYIVLLGVENKGVLAVEADLVRIKEVVENLVSNAVKYSPSGGTIIITVEKKEGDALISICDQGPGIATGEQPQIFDRFFMSSHTRQKCPGGLGLGLHISKQLVELHQGQIWLESKVGEGSTFYFTLPLLLSGES